MSVRRQRLASLFGGTGRLAALATALAAAQTAMLVPVALLVRHMFDAEIPAHDTGGIAVTGLLILALYLGSAGLAVLGHGLAARAVKRTTAALRNRLLERLYLLPQSWHDRRNATHLQSLVVSDTEHVDRMVDEFVSRLYPAAVVGIALTVVGLALSPLLFGLVLIGVPVPFLLARAMGSRFRRRVRTWRDAFEALAAATQLSLRALTLTKVHGAEEYELGRRRDEIEALSDAARAMVWAEGAYIVVQNAVSATTGSLVLIAGGIAVADGSMTLGALLSFYAVMALLLRQLATFAQGAPTIVVGFESLARLDELLDAEEREPYHGERRIELTGRIAFERVTFAYESEPVLRDIDLVIAPGERVVITGPNGAGKSTLLSLLIGLYRPGEGRVLLDGVPLGELDLRHARGQMGVVLQDPVIFPGTIRDNIAYAQPGATDAQVEAAARVAAVDRFADDLPAGYDTQVGDEGELLSGGQRQRIAIARAVLARPALLILDEPTTYLDGSAVTSFLAELEELPEEPTVLIVTHSDEVGARAERLISMRDGTIEGDERRVPVARLAARRSARP
jgi:ABC-type multidrug transport system fused ATPase/permease subunit